MSRASTARTLSIAALGAALALLASAGWSRLPGASAALAGEQPQEDRPTSGLISQTEVLLRIERQLEETNRKLAEVKAQLSSVVPVRIVEPLPPGLRLGDGKPAPAPAEKPKTPAGDKPADPQSSVPGHPSVHPAEPKSPNPGGPR